MGKESRHGSALIVVLIVIVMLSLGAYSFSELMVTESRAARLFEKDAQARLLADSGIELAAAVLGAPQDLTLETLYHAPSLFGGIPLTTSGNQSESGRYALVAPIENATAGIRNGMIDESSRWNLNALFSLDLKDDELFNILISIPGMTETAADSILDWADSDDEVRMAGAESVYYQGLSPPYACKNGHLESLDELLLVQGVTPELLYGEDANRNGLLDPNEDDGDVSPPYDNEDHALDPGLSAYLTVYSAESNLRADGGARINVNQPLLTSLYDELQEQYGDEIATFIVAFRMSGAVEPVSDGGQATTGDQSTDEAIKGVAEDVAKGLFKSGGDTSVTRGGMDLSAGGKVNFVSLYELIDAQVEATVNQKPAVLSSPWSSDNLQSDWAMVADGLTLSDATSIDGRININQARREVLLGIPGITEEMVDAIVSQTQVASSGVVVDDRKSTTAWLLTDGIMDLPTLVAMDKFMTARGAVQRVQSVGFFDSGGPVARVEAVIDGSQSPPRIVYRRDLSSLGPGYSADELTGITK